MVEYSEKYENEVLRKLERFKGAREWSDFIEPLDSLVSLFKKSNFRYIPHIMQLVKRLNQLLHPTLPGGVHLKAIECYQAIFENIGIEKLEEDFDILTIGLFSFSTNCRILIANEYLNLLETIISKLGSRVEKFSKYIVIGILPFLESESSEFFMKAFSILISFSEQISLKSFYTALWRNFIDYPDLRINVINFLNNTNKIVIPDYSLATNAFCLGLEKDNPFVIRTVLEFSNRNFPFKTEIIESDLVDEIQNSNKSNDTLMDSKESSSKNKKNDKHRKGIDLVHCTTKSSSVSTLLLDQKSSQSNGMYIEFSEESTKNIEKRVFIDLSDNERDPSIIENEKARCNLLLLRSILKIFLKKEVSLTKRAFKWLQIGDSISEQDVDYLERGLSTYLNGSDEDLLMFFKIVNSLTDKENLVGFIMERLVIRALNCIRKINNKKNLDILINIKKNAKTFLDGAIDDFYRVIYMTLDKTLNSCLELDDTFSQKSICEDSSSSSEIFSIKSNKFDNQPNSNNAEEIIKIVIFCIEALDTINQNVSTIHLPLLCHLIVNNKKKISHSLFSYMLQIFIELSESTPGSVIKDVTGDLIARFYNKEDVENFLEINLIGSIAKELGKLSIYKQTENDPIYWSESILIEKDGILLWSESKNVIKIKRNNGGFINFVVRDIEFLQRFIQKNGTENLDENFLKIVGRYLCFNYNFIYLIRKLDSYIDKNLLFINLWNDFILTKNPSYIVHYPEELFLPFLRKLLPTVCVSDICIFLDHTLKYGMYIDILFRVSAIIDPKSIFFTDLILNATNTMPIIKYILNRHFSCAYTSDPYSYDFNLSSLYILHLLLDNSNFQSILAENNMIFVEPMGEIALQKVVLQMVFSILSHNSSSIDTNQSRSSVLLNYKNHLFYKDNTLNSRGKSNYLKQPTSQIFNRNKSLNYEAKQSDQSAFLKHDLAQKQEQIANICKNVAEDISKLDKEEYKDLKELVSDKNKELTEVLNLSADVKKKLDLISNEIVENSNILEQTLSTLNQVDNKSDGIDTSNAGSQSTFPTSEPNQVYDKSNRISTSNAGSQSNLPTSALNQVREKNDGITTSNASSKSSLTNLSNSSDISTCISNFNSHKVVDFNPDSNNISEAFNLLPKGFLDSQRSVLIRLIFDVLSKLNLLNVPIQDYNMDTVQKVIVALKNDFYILKKSLFLVSHDIQFIYENYLHCHKLILQEIFNMPIKHDFFSYLTKINVKSSVEILHDSFKYISKIKNFKMNEMYSKAIVLMAEKVRNCAIVYKKKKGLFKLYRNKSFQKYCGFELKHAEPAEEEPINLIYKDIYTEEEFTHVAKTEIQSLSKFNVIVNGDISTVLELSNDLYSHNPTLFISSIPEVLDVFFLVSVLPFKIELCRRLLTLTKPNKFSVKLLNVLFKNLPQSSKSIILKSDAEFIRQYFVNSEYNYQTQCLAVELFRDQNPSDLSKLIFTSILQSHLTKIDSVIKHNSSYSEDINFLKYMVKAKFRDISITVLLKNCLFALLNSIKYRENAFDLIYLTLRLTPNCKIFIDAFVTYLNRNFFEFGLEKKKKLLELISSSSNFDSVDTLEKSFSGMNSSFFMSAQSEELLKIANLKKMGFLLLSQPKNKFAAMSDNFVIMINNLLFTTSVDVKIELIKLCTILILKIDNHYLQTLYPILVTEFVTLVKSKNLKLVLEVFRCVDVSIWLNSPVFNFKVLFLEDHFFNNALRSTTFSIDSNEELKIDYALKKTPNFLALTNTKTMSCADFSFYLKKAPEFYGYKDRHMIENDYEGTENAILESYLVNKSSK